MPPLDDDYDDADEPRVLIRPSMRRMISALGVGESFARAMRFDYENLSREELVKATNGLRVATVTSVTRAKEDTGNIYTIESGEIFTRSKALQLIIIVTRTK